MKQGILVCFFYLHLSIGKLAALQKLDQRRRRKAAVGLFCSTFSLVGNIRIRIGTIAEPEKQGKDRSAKAEKEFLPLMIGRK